MKVLLISPLRDLDVPCGDITYTDLLLAHPPEGVEYETYADALARGALTEHARREGLRRHPLLVLGNKAVSILRQKRLLFWEPYRFFSVKPGEYDLIHMHVFNARFLSLPCGLVTGSGAPQRDVYLDRRHFSPRRVAVLEAIEKCLARLFQVNQNSYYQPQAQRVMVYTEYYRDFLVNNGYVDAGRVSIVPLLGLAPTVNLMPRQPCRIGFVARNFDEKGGAVLLEAYRQVRAQHPDIELWIVGSPPQMTEAERQELGITWLAAVPREALMAEIMPSFDVFAYPTPHDCFSYVTLEAMSCGAAIATSDYVSMPEAVDYGRAGLTSPVGDASGLARNISALLDPETNFKFRQAARKRFEEHFAWEAVAPLILENYRQAIAAYGSGNTR